MGWSGFYIAQPTETTKNMDEKRIYQNITKLLNDNLEHPNSFLMWEEFYLINFKDSRSITRGWAMIKSYLV